MLPSCDLLWWRNCHVVWSVAPLYCLNGPPTPESCSVGYTCNNNVGDIAAQSRRSDDKRILAFSLFRCIKVCFLAAMLNAHNVLPSTTLTKCPVHWMFDQIYRLFESKYNTQSITYTILEPEGTSVHNNKILPWILLKMLRTKIHINHIQSQSS